MDSHETDKDIIDSNAADVTPESEVKEPETIDIPDLQPTDEQPFVDLPKLRALAQAGATEQDILEYFGLPMDFDLEPYRREIGKMRAQYRVNIRKKQLVTALDGNAQLLIFLGKHELGQTDRTTSDKPGKFPQSWVDSKMDDT